MAISNTLINPAGSGLVIHISEEWNLVSLTEFGVQGLGLAGDVLGRLVRKWKETLFADDGSGQGPWCVEDVVNGRVMRSMIVSISDDSGKILGHVATMTPVSESLADTKKDQILEAVNSIAEIFLRPGDWESRIGKVLRILGKAAEVSRAYLFENFVAEDERLSMRQRFEWTAPGVSSQINNEQLQGLAYEDSDPELKDVLGSGKTWTASVSALDSEISREVLAAQGILSLALVPVFVQNTWWGFLGFDHCDHEHEWNRGELSALRTAAEIVGSAILRNQVEQELMATMKQAEEANEVKTQFLANMSHELRTPLNGIMGATQLLQATEVNKEQRKFLGIIHQSSWNLAEIINDLLELSALDAGTFFLEPKIFSPYSTFQSLFGMFATSVDEKQVSFHTFFDSSLPRRISADVKRIKQVLINLLGNAFKFTNRGEVRVTVACHGGLGGGKTLFFEIRDTGIGIPVMRQASIFDHFTLGEHFLTKKHGGTGMGLAISRQLVEAMGGQIWFESEYGQGSVFYFTVPVETVDEEEDVLSGLEASGFENGNREGRPLSILLAEDEQANRIVAARVLKNRGHKVMVAKNGVQALDRLSARSFDLVLLDIQMPVLNGMEVIRRIRNSEVGGVDPKIPVIAITAFAHESDKERFLAAGMNDCVCKPYRPDDLLMAIERVMGLKS